MNVIDRPPVDPIVLDRSSDDLEELLHAYFKNELPNPWPALVLPAPARTMRSSSPWEGGARGGSMLRSRFALAASIALLVLGSFWLAGTFRGKQAPAGANAGNEVARPVIVPPRTMP